MTATANVRVVVVGGGTAGCMVVSYLANNTDADIVLVEPGPSSVHDDSSRFFDVIADASLIRVQNGILQARVLGGGSAINGMLMTGDEPPFAQGLTRMATSDDIGVMGQFLLSQGGRCSRMWWNGGRWNPGRAVRHLEEEGRIRIVRDEVLRVKTRDQEVSGVTTSLSTIEADIVVLCAGAIRTPQVLVESQLMTENQIEIRNHYSFNFVVELASPSEALFDSAVVKEVITPDGYEFLIHAYERVNHSDDRHGLLSIVHMNPVTAGFDMAAMEVALRELISTARQCDGATGVKGIIVDDAGMSLKDFLLLGDVEHEEWFQRNVRPVSHPACSCAKVTSEDGQVHGVRGVWVADASVLRSIPTCTPAAPVTMEALRIAHIIAKEIA